MIKCTRNPQKSGIHAYLPERCHRCHRILTSEDKYWYGVACESCDTDLKWEEYEQNNPIKSAHWRWRAICFGLRVLWNGPQAIGSLLLQRLRRPSVGKRSEFRHDRRR